MTINYELEPGRLAAYKVGLDVRELLRVEQPERSVFLAVMGVDASIGSSEGQSSVPPSN